MLTIEPLIVISKESEESLRPLIMTLIQLKPYMELDTDLTNKKYA